MELACNVTHQLSEATLDCRMDVLVVIVELEVLGRDLLQALHERGGLFAVDDPPLAEHAGVSDRPPDVVAK